MRCTCAFPGLGPFVAAAGACTHQHSSCSCGTAEEAPTTKVLDAVLDALWGFRQVSALTYLLQRWAFHALEIWQFGGRCCRLLLIIRQMLIQRTASCCACPSGAVWQRLKLIHLSL